MSRTLIVLLSLTLLVSTTSAKQVSSPQSSSAAQGATEAPDSAAIDALLRRYEKAYNHQSMDELLAIWPDLKNDKKQLQKIKSEFGPNISEMKVSMQAQEIQTTGGGDRTVKCLRSEHYEKLESTGYAPSDLGIQQVPSQAGDPSTRTHKKQIQRTNLMWITAHKAGDDWVILSVTDKKPR